MPLFDYLCSACGRTSEVLQKLNEPPLTACPHCGGPVRKQFSAPAFQFKGSGWYATDYAKKSGGAESPKPAGETKSDAAAPASDGKSSSESAGSAPSEAKGVAKSEGKSEPKSSPATDA